MIISIIISIFYLTILLIIIINESQRLENWYFKKCVTNS